MTGLIDYSQFLPKPPTNEAFNQGAELGRTILKDEGLAKLRDIYASPDFKALTPDKKNEYLQPTLAQVSPEMALQQTQLQETRAIEDEQRIKALKKDYTEKQITLANEGIKNATTQKEADLWASVFQGLKDSPDVDENYLPSINAFTGVKHVAGAENEMVNRLTGKELRKKYGITGYRDDDILTVPIGQDSGKIKGKIEYYKAPASENKTDIVTVGYGSRNIQAKLTNGVYYNLDGVKLDTKLITPKIEKTPVSERKIGEYTRKQSDILLSQKDKIVKQAEKQTVRLQSANDAYDLIQSGNPVASQAVKTAMARLSGEVGVLTNKDVARFSGSKAVFDTIKQAIETGTTGTLTPENAKYLSQVLNIYRSNAAKAKNKIIDQNLKSISKSTGLDISEIKDYYSSFYEEEPNIPTQENNDSNVKNKTTVPNSTWTAEKEKRYQELKKKR